MMNNVQINGSKRGLRLECLIETRKQKVSRYLDLIHRKTSSVPARTEKSQYEIHSNIFAFLQMQSKREVSFVKIDGLHEQSSLSCK